MSKTDITQKEVDEIYNVTDKKEKKKPSSNDFVTYTEEVDQQVEDESEVFEW